MLQISQALIKKSAVRPDTAQVRVKHNQFIQVRAMIVSMKTKLKALLYAMLAVLTGNSLVLAQSGGLKPIIHQSSLRFVISFPVVISATNLFLLVFKKSF